MRVLKKNVILPFRFEPLVAKDYSRIKPVGIQAYGIKTDYSNMPIETLGDSTDSPVDDTNSIDSKILDSKKGNETFKKFGIWFSRSGNTENKTNLNQLDNGSYLSSKDNSPIECMNILLIINENYLFTNKIIIIALSHRLDYILRDSIGGSASNYLSMLYTHTSYWSNYDVAYFIYTQLFPESEKIIEDSPESLNMAVNFEKLSEPEQGNVLIII